MSDFQSVERKLDETHSKFKSDFSDKLHRLEDTVADLQQKSGSRIDFSSAPPRPSLMKIIKHLSNPRDNPLDGKEREWHSELAEKNGGIPGTGNAVWLPLQTKNFDYSSSSPLSGAHNLVPTTTLDLIDVLRAESVVLRQGVTEIPAQGNLSIPRKTSASTGYWISGDGEAITPSHPVVTSISLTPKFVGGLVTVSYRMMPQTGGAVERILQQDLAGTLAEAFDLAALQGTGANSQPTGVLGAVGIGSIPWGGAASPAAYSTTRFWLNDAAEMEQNLIVAKAYKGNLAFLMDAASFRSLRFQEDEGKPLTGFDDQGRLLGLPVTPTTFMPANTAILGNWSELLFASYGGIALAVDQGGDNFAKGDTSVRAILPCDFGVRHAASFVKCAKT